MRARWFAVLLFFAVAPACARRIRTPPPPEAFNGNYYRFPTGLQLAVYEDPAAARVSVTVSYGSGSHLDPAGEEGTAHLVEHLAGRGRAEGGRSIDARLFALGSDDNAYTTADETTYFADVPATALEALLALEAERMRDPLANVSEQEFVTERAVVETELYQRAEEEDAPAALLRLALAQLFMGHPYGRPVGGSDASLRRIQLSHVRQWARMHYTPDNAVIVVHGPVQSSATRTLVERAFGGLAAGDAAHPPSPPMTNSPPDAPPPLRRPAALKTVVAPISTRELWLVWAAPGRISDEEVKVHGAAVALDFALTRRLREDTRIERIVTTPLVMDGMTMVVARLELKPHVDALQLHDELTRSFEIGGHQLWSGELADDVADQLSAHAFDALERGFGPTAAQYVRTRRRSDFAAAWRDQVASGATSSLFEDAQRYFPREQMRSLLFVPTAVGKPFREDPPVRLSVKSESDLTERGLPEGAPPATSIMAAVPGLETFELPNGLQVVLVRRSRLPTVELRLVFRTRPNNHAAIPELPMIAVLESSGAFGFRGDRMAYDNHVVWESRLRPDALDQELGAVSDWAKNNRIYPQGHQYMMEVLARILERMPETSAPRVENFSREHLYGARAETFKEAAARVKGLHHSSVESWLARELRPQNATLILVGDLPPLEEVKTKAFWSFFGWSNATPSGAPPSSKGVQWDTSPVPKAARALLHPRRSALAHLRVSVRTPQIRTAQLAEWMLVTSLVEDRLRTELRERKGIAYGVHTTLDDAPSGSMITVEASVRPEHAAEVVAFIREVLRRTAQDPVPDPELDRARWNVARSFDSGFSTLEDVADRLQGVVVRDATPALWTHYRETIGSANAEAVSKVARELVVGAEAITIVGNLGQVEAQLKTAGLAVEVVK